MKEKSEWKARNNERGMWYSCIISGEKTLEGKSLFDADYAKIMFDLGDPNYHTPQILWDMYKSP